MPKISQESISQNRLDSQNIRSSQQTRPSGVAGNISSNPTNPYTHYDSSADELKYGRNVKNITAVLKSKVVF